jgi:4-hydroxy-tetrahydrodipicolinate synthase
MDASGCGTALVTPFRKDGAVDEPALGAFVEWQVNSGIRFLVSCGSTGEAATLSDEEWLHVVALTVEAARGRVPVWAGCTHNATSEAVARARRLRQVPGIEAVLSASPYYNKPTQEGQYRHFRAIAEAIHPLALVLYNVPGRTGVSLEPATVLRLAYELPNVRAVKESGGRLAPMEQIVHGAPAGFRLFSGDDDLGLAAIAVGAAGLVSVASNEAPAEMAEMIALALEGRWAAAREINRRLFRLIEANFWESNPGPAKAVLAMMGRMEETVRLPLVPPSASIRSRLESLAGELGLLAAAPGTGLESRGREGGGPEPGAREKQGEKQGARPLP